MTKFVITDPSYILPKEVLDKCVNSKNNFEDMIANEINKISRTTNSKVANTGVDEWLNKIHTANDKNKCIHPYFTSNTGLVCVVEYNKQLEKQFDNELFLCSAALIEIKGKETIKFLVRKNCRTIIKIYDDDCLVFESHF